MSGPYSTDELISERYKIKGFLGQGGMQFVYLAQDVILNRDVALKVPKNSSAHKRFHKSAILAAKINHSNVAKTLDYFNFNDSPHLIEEVINGHDLSNSPLQKMTRFDPYLVARIFHHLAKGLAASHHAGVVHRDLKPSNIMLGLDWSAEIIKITDFGIATMAQDEMENQDFDNPDTITSSTVVGALPYMAPEAIENPKHSQTKSDVWSLGAMIFELLAGEKPFGKGLKSIKRIMDADFVPFPTFVISNLQFKPLAEELIQLIVRCLAKNPANRPSADDVVFACGQLCYPVAERFVGSVNSTVGNSGVYGFITPQTGGSVFYHSDSVYAEKVTTDDKVVFSKFSGGGSDRAHPVIKLRTIE